MTSTIPGEAFAEVPPQQATIPIAELPLVLHLDTGPQISPKEVASSFEGLMPRGLPMTRLTGLLHPKDWGWRSEVEDAARDAITGLAHFTEGEVTRADRAELWRQPASVLADDRAGNKGLDYLTDQLKDLGGACEPAHVLRNDGDKTGTRVTAGQVLVPGQREPRACFFIEDTVPTGIGNSTHRRLSVIAASHPQALATVNQYSFDERIGVQRILNQMDIHADVRAAVLASANRLTAPDAQTLDMLVKESVRAFEEAEDARIEAGEGKPEREIFMGAAATAEALIYAAQHPKVQV